MLAESAASVVLLSRERSPSSELMQYAVAVGKGIGLNQRLRRVRSLGHLVPLLVENPWGLDEDRRVVQFGSEIWSVEKVPGAWFFLSNQASSPNTPYVFASEDGHCSCDPTGRILCSHLRAALEARKQPGAWLVAQLHAHWGATRIGALVTLNRQYTTAVSLYAVDDGIVVQLEYPRLINRGDEVLVSRRHGLQCPCGMHPCPHVWSIKLAQAYRPGLPSE